MALETELQLPATTAGAWSRRSTLPPAPPANAPRLEFIGDSITAGMGAVGDNAAAGTCNSGGDVSGMPTTLGLCTDRPLIGA